MRFLTVISATLLSSLLVLGGESKRILIKSLEDPALDTIVVARVGDRRLTAREFVENYYFGPACIDASSQPRRAILEGMIAEALLAQAATDSVSDLPGIIAPTLAAIEGDLATEELYRHEIWDTVRVSPRDVDQALRESSRSFAFRWLFAPDRAQADSMASRVRAAGFDSVYALCDSSVQRSRTEDAFHLRMTSPAIHDVVHSMKQGAVSEVVRGPDGYYILRVDRVVRSSVVPASRLPEARRNIERELRQFKAGMASDQFVDRLMKTVSPVIQRNAFNLLTAYIGKQYLAEGLFEAWNLKRYLMTEAGPLPPEEVGRVRSLPLVNLRDGNMTLGEFIDWFALRSHAFKFSTAGLAHFFASVEGYVWRMVRDELLVRKAASEGYASLPSVQADAGRWKGKLSALAMLEEIIRSTGADTTAVHRYFLNHYRRYGSSSDTSSQFSRNYERAERDRMDEALTARLFHAKTILERCIPVVRYLEIVEALDLPLRGDAKSVGVLVVKKSGTFPRKAFPTFEDVWCRILQ